MTAAGSAQRRAPHGPPTPSGLRFQLLGGPAVLRDGQQLPMTARMQRALLAILVVEAGHVVSADRLIDHLWAGQPPDGALGTLQVYISQLRRLLEPDRAPRAPARLLVTRDPGYALRAPLDRIDTWRFEQLAGQVRLAVAADDPGMAARLADEALTIWTGDPLPEFADEPWAVPVVGRMIELHATLREDRVDAWLGQGHPDAALIELERLVAGEPLRERRWAQLALALYRCDRQADALAAVRRARTVLADGLGLEPGPTLRRLEQAILRHSPELDPARPDDAGSAGTPAAASSPAAATATDGPAAADSGGDPDFAPGPDPDLDGPAATPLVIRDELAARIDTRIRGLPRHGGAVLLIGEAGIGKTTLAQEAATLAAELGHTVVWSHCPDADAMPAYWPWLQILRAIDGPEAAAARAALAGGGPGDEPGTARFLIYDAVAVALTAASRRTPLVIVVDDVHAADLSTLRLLGLLAGDLARLPVLLLLTARESMPSRVREALAEALTRPGSERLAVPGLDEAQVARYAELTLAGRPHADLVHALRERTGGNPFYLGEIVRLLQSQHRNRPFDVADIAALDVPAGVRDVLGRRVARLPADTQGVLAVAAVVGDSLDLDVLEAVSGTGTEQVMLALDPAVAAGMLIETAQGWGYRFRHGLVRDAIYATLPPVRRGRLHHEVAIALVGLRADDPGVVPAVAHHYLAAGPFAATATAVAYARRAAAQAVRQAAWPEAAALLERALELLTARAAGDVRTRCEVLTELGTVRRSAADITGAHEAFGRAAAAYGTVALWGSRPTGEQDDQLIGLLQEQLVRLGTADPALRVRLLGALSSELLSAHRRIEAEPYAVEGVVLARSLADPELLGLALHHRYRATLPPAYAAERLDACAEALTLVGRGLPQLHEIVIRMHYVAELAIIGDLAAMDTELDRCRHLAGQLHSPEISAHLHFIECGRACFDGRWDDARRWHDQACTHFERVRSPGVPWLRLVGRVLISRGTGELGRLAGELCQQVQHPAFATLRPAAVLAVIEEGRPEAAAELAGRWFGPLRDDWDWMLAASYWAAVSARLGVPDPATMYGLLAPYAGQLAIAGNIIDAGGSVDALLGALAARSGRRDVALRHATAGLELERRAGLTAWVPRTSALVASLQGDG